MDKTRVIQQQFDIGIVGGGITGLIAAYELSQSGLSVILWEAEQELGGLAASFYFNNQPLERFYHHIFEGDQEIINLINEVGLDNQLIFGRAESAIYWSGKLHPFSKPTDLLKFQPLNLWQRLISGYNLWYLKKTAWRNLDNISASAWLRAYLGEKSYQILWQPLLEGKFGKYSDDIALGWFWSRLARSENLGYLRGGFENLFEKLENLVEKKDGSIKLGETVETITPMGSGFELKTNIGEYRCEKVLVTTAPKIFNNLISNYIDKSYRHQYYHQHYFGTICLILSLKQQLTPYYWININDLNCPFIVMVEHTNWQPKYRYHNQNIIYLNRYCPNDDKFYKMRKEGLIEAALPWLKKMNANFSKEWIEESYLFWEPFAQPIVDVKYHQTIPDIKTSLKNLYLASMAQIYPYDRGLNYAVKQAKEAAKIILKEGA